MFSEKAKLSRTLMVGSAGLSGGSWLSRSVRSVARRAMTWASPMTNPLPLAVGLLLLLLLWPTWSRAEQSASQPSVTQKEWDQSAELPPLPDPSKRDPKAALFKMEKECTLDKELITPRFSGGTKEVEWRFTLRCYY